MKIRPYHLIVPCLLWSCANPPSKSAVNSKFAQYAAMSSMDQAANSVYLNDAVEATGEEIADEQVSQEAPSGDQVSSEVPPSSDAGAPVIEQEEDSKSSQEAPIGKQEDVPPVVGKGQEQPSFPAPAEKHGKKKKDKQSGPIVVEQKPADEHGDSSLPSGPEEKTEQPSVPPEDQVANAPSEPKPSEEPASEPSSSDQNAPLDPSVEEDSRPKRVEQMVGMMMDMLDSDKSASLSREEFLAVVDKGPKAGRRGEVVERYRSRIKERLGAEFDKYAGADLQLSSAEVGELLKGQKRRIGLFRKLKRPGQQAHRVLETWDQLIKKYDKNSDGLIDQTEFEALKAELLRSKG